MNTRKGLRSTERERIIIAGVQSRKPMKAIAHECGISIPALSSWINHRPELKMKLANIRKKYRRPVTDELAWARAKNQIANLEKVLANPPAFKPRTLKAPSNPEFAFKALYAFVEGLPSGST